MSRDSRLSAALAVALAFAAPFAALAQGAVDVQFAPGNFGTMVSGAVTGDGYLDLRLGAGAGQQMFVELTATSSTGNGSVFFNVLPPGSDGVAIYNGSMDGNSTVMPLPETGTYAIRIYQMGNDRDTGVTTNFNVDLSIQ